MVVRHRLPAGSSHPLTDVVGDLVTDGEELVVRRRDGALVHVDRRDVLRLKVVPARAVAASAIRELEHAAALGWPGLEQAWHAGWLLRAGGGVTQRACSAVPLAGPHGDDAPATADPASLAVVVDFYRARGLVPRVLAVDRLGATPPGWPTGPEVVVMTGRTDAGTGADPGVAFAAEPDAAWLARWGRGADRPAVAERVVRAALSTELAFLSLDGGAAIARVGVSTLPSGAVWAGLTGVVVDPARRREGLGARVSRAAGAWAAQRGASRVCLQVEAGNDAGRALWASLGLTEHHRYRYATPPA
ncbi:GNAT family N-acetyltransferase [Rhodococcus aerolatus]